MLFVLFSWRMYKKNYLLCSYIHKNMHLPLPNSNDLSASYIHQTSFGFNSSDSSHYHLSPLLQFGSNIFFFKRTDCWIKMDIVIWWHLQKSPIVRICTELSFLASEVSLASQKLISLWLSLYGTYFLSSEVTNYHIKLSHLAYAQFWSTCLTHTSIWFVWSS